MENIYTQILELIRVKEDFNYESYKRPMLKRRIDNRILKVNAENPQKYLSILKNDPQELEALTNNFLINVSHFFRDPLAFEFFNSKILPSLIERIVNSKHKSLRFWSAGCASGEEVYSMAILIQEYLEKEKQEIDFVFFASDLDDTALERARVGLYSKEQLKNVKLELLEKYFLPETSNYRVNPMLKSKINFLRYDLLDKRSYVPSESIFGGFDLVLCRNVLIYFNEEAQNHTFQKLYKALKGERILFLGEAEIPTMDFQSKFYQINDCCKIYRKVKDDN